MSTIRKDNEADQISYNGWVAGNIRLTKDGKWLKFNVTPPNEDAYKFKIKSYFSILDYLKQQEYLYSVLSINSSARTTTASYRYDTKEAKDLADEFQEYLDGLAHATDEEIMQKWDDSQFANQESEYQKRIAEAFDSVRDMMLKKNEEYGDSVFQSIELFGHSIDAMTACLARISDKFKRLETLGLSEASVDTLDDLVGYLIALKLIIEDEQDFELDQQV